MRVQSYCEWSREVLKEPNTNSLEADRDVLRLNAGLPRCGAPSLVLFASVPRKKSLAFLRSSITL